MDAGAVTSEYIRSAARNRSPPCSENPAARGRPKSRFVKRNRSLLIVRSRRWSAGLAAAEQFARIAEIEKSPCCEE